MSHGGGGLEKCHVLFEWPLTVSEKMTSSLVITLTSKVRTYDCNRKWESGNDPILVGIWNQPKGLEDLRVLKSLLV